MILQRSSLPLILVISILCVACARLYVKPVEWPDDLPPMDYYENAYEQDPRNRALQSRDKYLTWVRRFYMGWDLYQDGWLATTRDILLGIEDEAARQRVEEKLFQLGKLLSAEWAKDSPERAVRTRELSIWGQALLKSLDHQRQEKLVDHVTRDVNALLGGSLDRTDINLKRYVETAGDPASREL